MITQGHLMNRDGTGGSIQPSNVKTPEFNLSDADGAYMMTSVPFQIKIETNAIVPLTVMYAKNDYWITTSFFPQWNPDLIKGLRETAANIKIGW